jgi:hypothetical protein
MRSSSWIMKFDNKNLESGLHLHASVQFSSIKATKICFVEQKFHIDDKWSLPEEKHINDFNSKWKKFAKNNKSPH